MSKLTKARSHLTPFENHPDNSCRSPRHCSFSAVSTNLGRTNWSPLNQTCTLETVFAGFCWWILPIPFKVSGLGADPRWPNARRRDGPTCIRTPFRTGNRGVDEMGSPLHPVSISARGEPTRCTSDMRLMDWIAARLRSVDSRVLGELEPLRAVAGPGRFTKTPTVPSAVQTRMCS